MFGNMISAGCPELTIVSPAGKASRGILVDYLMVFNLEKSYK